MFQFQLCVTPERAPKTRRIMEALRGCFPDHAFCHGFPRPGRPFVVWGHRWLGSHIVPSAWENGIPFFFVDNGYYIPANGSTYGYYSITYRSFGPMLLKDPDLERLPVPMKEWKPPADHPEGTVLVCLPGEWFGRMFGWDMTEWAQNVVREIAKHTDRYIKVRNKNSGVPFESDLRRAAVVVTHSSKSAVQAVLQGIPCIVESLNPALPVCGNDLSQIENPPMPDRRQWWASLMCQQFTLDEMRQGEASRWLRVALEQGEADKQPGLPPYSILLNRVDPSGRIWVDDVPEPLPEPIMLTVPPGQRLFVNGVEVDLRHINGPTPKSSPPGLRRERIAISGRA